MLSLLLGGLGVAFGGAHSADSAGGAAPMSADGVSVQATGLNSGDLGFGSTDDSAEASPLWAPLLAKGGLSFFIAFCIGYALRTFLKGTMLVIGVTSLAIFGLHKAGVVTDIDWSKAQGYWDDLTANLGRQFESLKTFVTGSLPSAGSGAVGLIAGFRR